MPLNCNYGASWQLLASFTPNAQAHTHRHANDRTQIFCNDKQAEYSTRPLSHLRSALLLMIKAKDVLSMRNSDREREHEIKCMV